MEEKELELRDIIKILKKWQKLIVNIFLGFVLITLVVSFLIPKTYESEVNLRVKQQKGLASSLLADLPTGSPGGTKQLMSTYAEILKSRTVIEEVIKQTQTDKEAAPLYEDFIKSIATMPVKDTEILNVKVQAKSPEEAQKIADALVDTFLKRLTGLVRAEQSVVKEFIGKRLQESKKELEQAEGVLQEYKQNEKIIAPEDETRALVDKLATVDKMLADNKVSLAAAQARISSSKQQLGAQKAGFIGDNALTAQYKGKLADLEVQLVGLSQNYTDKHPKVVATKAAIKETKSLLNQEITRVVQAEAMSANPIHQGLLQSKLQAEAEISIAQARQKALNTIVQDSQQDINKLPAKEQGLVKVMRDAAVARDIYIMLAKRYEEARISEVMEPTDVQVVDMATLPEKAIKPKKLLNVLIAAILGLMVGVGAAFALEFMNKTIQNPDDVEEYLDLPVLGSIPNFDKEAKKSKNPKNSWKERLLAKRKL